MNKLLTTLTICLIILLCGCGSVKKGTLDEADTIPQPTLNLNAQRPILFLHGSGGSEDNLVAFADSLVVNHSLPISHLSITISADNQLTYLGKLSNKAQQPLIFVGFEANNAPINDWSLGVKTLVEDLMTRYHFEAIDLVGFSNGGLAAAYYAESQSDFTKVPRLNKIVMIGAPFNDLAPLNLSEDLEFNDLSNQQAYLDQFLDKKQQLPQDLAVLSIAGNIEDGSFSDGVVPISSALSSRLIFPDYVKNYEERLSTGPSASHVGLVSQNQEVTDWVSDFLFDYQPSSSPLVENMQKR